MRPEEIREMSDTEITEKLRDLSQELFDLKLRGTYEELENPLKLRHLRRDIARFKTIRHERDRLAAGAEED